MKTTVTLCVVLLSIAGIGSGQGRYNRVNVAQTQIITGEITAVDVAYGAQYPSITVNQTVIKVAPLWFLLDQDFELQAGDTVTVVAAPCNLAGDSYLYAISITNTETSATIVLRNPNGLPLWGGAGGGRSGQRMQKASSRACFDPASVRTITGTIERVNFGAGIQMPTLVVKTADGLVTMKIGPERILLSADFELNPGEAVTATYATCLRENVAFQLTNTAGVTVILRNPDGSVSWN